MRRFMIACLWCMSSATICAQTPSPPRTLSPQDWTSSRRHFSFSNIVFDLDYDHWRLGGQVEPLTNCSNERTFCLSSPTFSLALPKQCSDIAVGHWAAGSIRTEVLLRHVASAPPLHGGGSDTTLYVGSPQRPHQLFVYDMSMGLKGLYWDERNEVDFVAMARERRLESWLSIRNGMPTRQDHYYPLTTLGVVGECRGGWQDRLSLRPG